MNAECGMWNAEFGLQDKEIFDYTLFSSLETAADNLRFCNA